MPCNPPWLIDDLLALLKAREEISFVDTPVAFVRSLALDLITSTASPPTDAFVELLRRIEDLLDQAQGDVHSEKTPVAFLVFKIT